MKRHSLSLCALCALFVLFALAGCGAKRVARGPAEHSHSAGAAKTAAEPESATSAGPGSEANSDTINRLFGGGSARSASPLMPNPAAKPSSVRVEPRMRPTAQQLLAALRNVYRSARSLRVEYASSAVTSRDGKIVQRSKTSSAISFKRPDKFAVTDAQMRLLCDGKTVVNYIVPAKRFTKAKASKEVIGSIVTASPTVSTLGLLFGVDYTRAVESMKLLPDTKVGGRDVFVLALKMKSPAGVSTSQKLWIGKRDLAVCKNEIITQAKPKRPKGYSGKMPKLITTTISGALVTFAPNAKIADSEFVFRAPAGASAVEPPKRVELMDKPAPDFQFRSADGTVKKLSDLRGKIVILDFWAVPMCEKHLPVLQTLYDTHKDDVEFVTISLNKDSKRVQEHLKAKNLTFPTAYATEEIGKVAATRYGIPTLPALIIIDREGIIRGGGFGSPSVKAVEAELQKMK